MKGPQVGERISEYVLEELVGAGSFGQAPIITFGKPTASP
jgi:hypothetical protein